MPDRTVAQLERDIARARLDLSEDVQALSATLRQKLDWRTPVRRRPLQACAVAFALGLWLGLS